MAAHSGLAVLALYRLLGGGMALALSSAAILAVPFSLPAPRAISPPTEPTTISTVPTVAELALQPDSGPAGTTVTVTATGYRCPASTLVGWAESGSWTQARPTNTVSVAYVATLVVPSDFVAGTHDVTAICSDGSFTWPPASFTVPAEEEEATLVVEPDRGVAGTPVRATATGHSCPGEVLIGWIDDRQTWKPADSADGAYTAELSVPATLDPGAHEVTASCGYDGFTWPSTGFTVSPGDGSTSTSVSTSAPTSVPDHGSVDTVPPRTSNGHDWWPVAVAIAGGGGLLLVGRHLLVGRRSRRWVRNHVRIRPAEGARIEMTIVRSSLGLPDQDAVVRVEPHEDPGTQTFEEVDR